VGKQKHGDREVLVQIRRFRKRCERLALAAIRRQREDLGVASLHTGDENRSDRRIADALAEDKLTVSEVKAQIFSGQCEFAYAVAFLGVETGLRDLPRQVRRGAGVEAIGE